MSDFFYTLQNERWARTVGVVSGLIIGVLQVIADSETWQVAVFAVIPMLFGLVTERKVWSQSTVDEIRYQDY